MNNKDNKINKLELALRKNLRKRKVFQKKYKKKNKFSHLVILFFNYR